MRYQRNTSKSLTRKLQQLRILRHSPELSIVRAVDMCIERAVGGCEYAG